MQLQPFDLNDIIHEPSDEQLDELMEAVATRRSAQTLSGGAGPTHGPPASRDYGDQAAPPTWRNE
jgi:hypothetical protein